MSEIIMKNKEIGWWKDKVAYQVYPKSFNDSNGDGIGDLRGIIQKLDYLKDLGVDIIWISPMYESPMVDQGYDISNYYKINPMFGSMEDMEELLVEAKKRDLYILLDLVISHCSDQHEWFQKAMQDLDSEYADYFYIMEGKDGNPPCNWRSYFGGSVWEPIEGTDKYYLHSFHKTQPDLNWENKVVRDKLYEMVCWWLEKGIDGFRIDAIVNIKKELGFKSYEPDRADGMCALSHMLSEAVGLDTFLMELKKNTFEKYNAFTVAELFNVKEGEEQKYVGDNGTFSTIFDFSVEIERTGNNWYESRGLNPEKIKQIIFESQMKNENIGMMANIIENHDEPRGASAFFLEDTKEDTQVTMLATAYLFLKGIPFIYQGQEIGMKNVAFGSIEEYDDIFTKDQYNVAIEAGLSKEEALNVVGARSRDNSRTPVQWNDKEAAGFTTGVPWLKIAEEYKSINVEIQEKREDSVLNHYKKLISLRKREELRETLVEGTFVPYKPEEENLFAYYRKGRTNDILVVCNYQKEERSLLISDSIEKLLYSNQGREVVENNIKLKGYESIILEVVSNNRQK